MPLKGQQAAVDFAAWARGLPVVGSLLDNFFAAVLLVKIGRAHV